MIPYAEVIGDPIAHSRSPAIHCHWLARLGIAGDYRGVQVTPADLADHLAARRADPAWAGCNVTIPHKQSVIPLLDRLAPSARAVGAVNTVVSTAAGLEGRNTDLDGIGEALAGIALAGHHAAIVGAGGAARAAVAVLASAGAARIALVARDPDRAAALHGHAPERIAIHHFSEAATAFGGARLVVNASPLGMTGCAAMPDGMLDALALADPAAAVFDMVYAPERTALLDRAGALGMTQIGGLAMLVGQARAAFRAFFGAGPPRDDAPLRAMLAAARDPVRND